MEIQLLLSVTIALVFIWFIRTHCLFCHAKLSSYDRGSNGRIRYRKKGTNFPVCKNCGKRHPSLVE